MPLEQFEPDALELKIAASTYLPACAHCGHTAVMSSSINREPLLSKQPVYQARIACTNCECNASVVANERTRGKAQQHAIAQWSRRAEATAPELTLTVEDVRAAKQTARQVFEGDCNHTFDAIEYFAELLEAASRASRAAAPVHTGERQSWT
ncbi:Lar family restriction alleviation protein [Burkholderia ubonensis]|uniref:Lar family restriction alleviation protein n=1 Tax=Burkholderia ubonensis TaxID=101571 RepID=UPI000754B61F|nr:Lar family restriction alleviation protein [Burkholderia ubonensis]